MEIAIIGSGDVGKVADLGQDIGHGPVQPADGPLEESPSCPGITPWGDEHVNDLAELVTASASSGVNRWTQR